MPEPLSADETALMRDMFESGFDLTREQALLLLDTCDGYRAALHEIVMTLGPTEVGCGDSCPGCLDEMNNALWIAKGVLGEQ